MNSELIQKAHNLIRHRHKEHRFIHKTNEDIIAETIVYPTQREILVDGTKNILVTRLDNQYTLDQLQKNLPFELSASTFNNVYTSFVEDLVVALAQSHSKDTIPFQIYAHMPTKLAWYAQALIGDNPVVSLDPLEPHRYNLEVSRAFALDGKFIKLDARPESLALRDQIEDLKHSFPERVPITLYDDDTFTGSTALEAYNCLKKQGLQVDTFVFGIKFGQQPKLAAQNVEIHAGVTYLAKDGVDLYNFVDYLDFRDLLIGASGFVVQLPSGKKGRLPGILSFVSPHLRLSVPKNEEKAFSLAMIDANMKFYNNLELGLNKIILLKDMPEEFVTAMEGLYGFDPYMRLVDMLQTIKENIDILWGYTLWQGKLQHQKETRLS